MGNPGADRQRLSQRLDQIANISDTDPGDGITRLAYTNVERAAHAAFAEWMEGLGLQVYSDVVGNTIAEHPGTSGGPALGTGSHLDSVPRGGRFDGIAGVVAAAEVAEMLIDKRVQHRKPWRFVVFAAEEGARFGQACIGSKAAGGMWTPDSLENTHDADGVSLADAMSGLGFRPDGVEEAKWSPDDWECFVELHIEQGAVLESAEIPIGLVDQISGSTRFQLHLAGRASHTGGTPMSLRADAGCAAAEITLLVEALANDPNHRRTRCTVGKLELAPGSITTIPGQVSLWIDVRDVDSNRQRHTADAIVKHSKDICSRRNIDLTAHLLGDTSPVILPTWLRDTLAQTCTDNGRSYRVMYSGASHDSQMISHVAPTGMLFVPSRAGLSHVPEESTSISEIGYGTDALFESLTRLDSLSDCRRE